MLELVRPSTEVEWKAYEDVHLKQAQVRKFINGHMTTCIHSRISWVKHGRQGAWQKAVARAKQLNPKP